MDDKLDAAGVVDGEGVKNPPPLLAQPRQHRPPPITSIMPVTFYARIMGRWSIAKDGKWKPIDKP